jgi:predicted hydrocarbon binding protein
MTEEIRGITELAFRSCIDSIEDIMGANGKNSVLKYAGLAELIESPPSYNIEIHVQPNEKVTRFMSAVREIMGERGYNLLMFRAGKATIDTAVAHNEPFQQLMAMDIEMHEKVRLAYFGYVDSTGDDPDKTIEFHLDENTVIMHFFHCNECEEMIKDAQKVAGYTKPACAYVRGVVHRVLEILGGVTVTSTEETCRVLGSDECRFVITYEVM